MEILSEIQRDVISEIVNIGIGRSASALSEMTGEEIRLSVPKCEFIQNEVDKILPEGARNSTLVTVRQSFSGEFFGDSILVFPEDRSLELVKLILDDSFPAESAKDLEEEALLEVGNLVLNGFLGAIGNELDVNIPTSLPFYSKVNGVKELIGLSDKDPEIQSIIMVIHVDFEIKNKNINGYVILLLDLSAIENFLELVDSYIARIT
jgi:chemotaxis protein CheC